jgi:hypothetical protein
MRTWKQDQLDRLAIRTLFQGVPRGDEYDSQGFNEMAQLLAQNLSYASYVRRSSFSDDSMAYATPWYTYDKRFYDEDGDTQNAYRGFVWSMWKLYGIRVASAFFTKNFVKHVDVKNQKILAAIERVFFASPYAGKWT